MEFSELIGKTITDTIQLQPQVKSNGAWITKSDTGYLLLKFSDGTECVIESYYDHYDGSSIGEYPTKIKTRTMKEIIETLSHKRETRLIPAV